MIAEFVANYVSYGFAAVGDLFDADDPAHSVMDAARYACWIQEARDSGDYNRADEVRDMALGFGCVVRIDKTGTHVIDGRREDIAAIHPVRMPDFSGYAEWVRPGEEKGRKVIETCYHHDGSGIHSVRVVNWRQHPNFKAAEDLQLPTALWSETGQQTLEHTKDVYWAEAQFEAIRDKILELSIARIMARAA